jgi:hypothetical protein
MVNDDKDAMCGHLFDLMIDSVAADLNDSIHYTITFEVWQLRNWICMFVQQKLLNDTSLF